MAAITAGEPPHKAFLAGIRWGLGMSSTLQPTPHLPTYYTNIPTYIYLYFWQATPLD